MGLTNRWSVPSTSGWNNVSFEALHCHDNGDVEFAVKLSGKSWCREEASELADNFCIEIGSVCILTSACRELLGKLDSWVHDHQPFACVLAATPDQGLDFEISRREDLITSTDKPALTICYARTGCRLEMFFVVDQSCLEQCKTELARVVAAFENE